MTEILRIIEILIGVSLVIAVHELGHFLAAKWAGVQVDEFALGMGPRFFSYKRGETTYSLRMIPIGGFVAMAGEEPGSETEAPLERQFRGQPPGKKAVIAVAGVSMNLVLGVILFALAFGIGINFSQPVIGAVDRERSRQIMDRLLAEIVRTQSAFAILDLSLTSTYSSGPSVGMRLAYTGSLGDGQYRLALSLCGAD